MRRLLAIDRHLWLLLALSIFAWAPLLNDAYFFQAHDAQHSIFYLVEFDQTWRDGYLWPRWSPDFAFGYGYPLFNLYAPLAIYAAALVHLLGVGKVVAVKLIYILATIGAGVSMYLFVRRIFGRDAGLLAAVVYIYAPFHLLEIYVRSAFAEYVSLALLPLVLWAFAELIAAPSTRRVVLAGGSYGLLALTHHTSFFTFTPFLILYILILVAGRARLDSARWLRLGGANLAAGLLGLMLAAIYLLPAVTEQRFVQVAQWTSGSYNAFEHFVYFSQLLSPDWGYSYSAPGPVDGMSFQIGIVIFGLAAFAVIGLIWRGAAVPHRGTVLLFAGAGLASIWLMSPLAAVVWEALPAALLIQFPWRLLIIVMLSLSVVAAAVVPVFEPDTLFLSFLSLIVILGSYAYTEPQFTEIPAWAEGPLSVIEWDAFSPQDRVGMVSYTAEQPTTSPLEAQYRNGGPLDAAQVVAGDLSVETIRRGGASGEVRVRGNGGTLQFYRYDYPGWRVQLDGQPVPHRPEPPYGLVTVDVPPGEHTLSIRMGTTMPRLVGGLLSLLAVLIIGGGLLGLPARRRAAGPL